MASIIEVIVTSVIFIIAAFGIMSTLATSQPQSTNSAKRLKAAFIGRQFLDELRTKVDARTWDQGNNDLSVGTHGPITVDGYDGAIRWTINQQIVDGKSDYNNGRYIQLYIDY